jgi:hypothetical protein
MRLCYANAIPHCENAEITPERRDDLFNFSFNNLRDALSSMYAALFLPFFHL